MTKNFQKELENILNDLPNKVPKLLMHSCCAPCSSYCMEYLTKNFEITVLYYNPNINSEAEYNKRSNEQKRLVDEMPSVHPIHLIVLPYDNHNYNECIKGFEKEKEGGARCTACFNLRLDKTAQLAKAQNFDYFTTTLTISPLKNASLINSIGYAIGNKYDVKWLPSDFKKLGGYKRSIELSREYNLYRQNYCGCIYSKNNQNN
ncbi:MAG TPA: epoxyqueuosine reductase QueH [Clostridia bacterium]|nr:epoxyqueuosine reductase QueH [Clostridia bacterium]